MDVGANKHSKMPPSKFKTMKILNYKLNDPHSIIIIIFFFIRVRNSAHYTPYFNNSWFILFIYVTIQLSTSNLMLLHKRDAINNYTKESKKKVRMRNTRCIFKLLIIAVRNYFHFLHCWMQWVLNYCWRWGKFGCFLVQRGYWLTVDDMAVV